jgi:signal transduction histidine kinase
MRSLYLRIWLTVVAALALFALVSGWMVQRHLEMQRSQAEAAVQERVAAWADLLQRTLPEADAPPAEQAQALQDWSQRLRVPMALDDVAGARIAASASFLRRQLDRPEALPRLLSIRLGDGRTLWVPRPGLRALARSRPGGPEEALDGPMRAPRHGDAYWRLPPPAAPAPAPWGLPGRGMLPDGVGLAALLAVLFLAVAAGAWPVVRRLTRRLEALKQGVEAFGAGALHQRVDEGGRDEVAAVASSFNRAAARIETLLRSHQSLLANASHELRSPLARLKMAVAMLDESADGADGAPGTPAQRAALRREIKTNIAELDALVEEVLLASRLDASSTLDRRDPVDLLPLAAEEAARLGLAAEGADLRVTGDERLLRRALRNLLENARRYGGDPQQILLEVAATTGGGAELRVCDRGPGVPEAWRERIFEPFFRLPGHAEREGGVGLGLALVRQIAQRHGGSVRCEAREGGGSCFVVSLPG